MLTTNQGWRCADPWLLGYNGFAVLHRVEYRKRRFETGSPVWHVARAFVATGRFFSSGVRRTR